MNSCLMCGKNTARPKYCSLHCANSAPRTKRVRNTGLCVECGAEYVANTNAQKFCSRSCAATRNNRIHPKRKNTRGLCLLCSMPVNSSIGIYCSRAHSVEHKNLAVVAEWLSSKKAGAEIKEGSAIRSYLYKDQGDVCALCPQTRSWNSQPLNFILDHIDGNSMDNSRENLRLVCPNCDFQLPTSKGKNRGNGRHNRRLRYANGESR